VSNNNSLRTNNVQANPQVERVATQPQGVPSSNLNNSNSLRTNNVQANPQVERVATQPQGVPSSNLNNNNSLRTNNVQANPQVERVATQPQGVPSSNLNNNNSLRTNNVQANPQVERVATQPQGVPSSNLNNNNSLRTNNVQANPQVERVATQPQGVPNVKEISGNPQNSNFPIGNKNTFDQTKEARVFQPNPNDIAANQNYKGRTDLQVVQNQAFVNNEIVVRNGDRGYGEHYYNNGYGDSPYIRFDAGLHFHFISTYRTMPLGYRDCFWHNRHYYWFNGGFYDYDNFGFYWMFPPIGFEINFIPANCYYFYYNYRPYYYYAGVFYVPIDNTPNYVVAEPPVGAIVQSIPDDATQLVIDGQIYLTYNNIIYKQVDVEGTTAYKVVGKLPTK
jgi:hypothetical protein